MKFACLLGGMISMASLVASAVTPPQIVGVPPSDAGRGLIRVNEKEIRHYSGDRKRQFFLVSRDNGRTWKEQEAHAGYPRNFGGIPKESPAFARNPLTGEFVRIQPVNSYVFITKGGLDGQWLAVTKDGKLTADWDKDESNLYKMGGIIRNPLFVNGGKRLIVPSHSMRSGSWVNISDDGGLTWKRSKDTVSAPPHEIGGPHKGRRWRNSGVEATIVELKDGRLWMLVRTSQDQYYESFSSDYGDTWSDSKPSRFFGTLTMPTIGRMSDGRLLALWTNTMALPEHKGTAGSDMWEDAFNNRDSHHAAISSDEGKTWTGFREIILDEHRNRDDYAHYHGAEDRGKHQSEFISLDKHRVLISLGQHSQHRKLVVLDTRWLYGKSRANAFENGLDDWSHQTYIPNKAGHASYNRKPSAELIANPTKSSEKVMRIKRLNDPELVSTKYDVDYQNGGATWNFPNGRTGMLMLEFYLPEGSGGAQISLTDRLFNGCDTSTAHYAIYTLPVAPGQKLGRMTLETDKWYTLGLQWQGVDEGGKCRVTINGRPVDTLKLNQTSPNGCSYIHLVSTAKKPDSGVLVRSVKAKVK